MQDQKYTETELREKAKISPKMEALMTRNGVIETEERYQRRLGILRQIHCGKPVEHEKLHALFNAYTKTFF